jgi:hypothetical protein
MRFGLIITAMLLAAGFSSEAKALELSDAVSLSGYGDLRLVAPDSQTSWVNGGLGKFRYGAHEGNFRFAEAVLQASVRLADGLKAVTVLRAEPEQRSGIDALEAYVSYAPQSDGALSWSAKTGAFFPTISLENDDLGWTSPYTLTPSAINSWIGEELRTIGSEAIAKWHSDDFGTFSLTAALDCCNDPAGILMADRGWAMDDRPTGLFERVRVPDATMRLFHGAFPARTGEFDEIDGKVGWYAGLGWQMPDIGKITVLRYDNEGDPAAATARDTAWATRFWSFGARTQLGPVMLIAQQLTGFTEVISRGFKSDTKFQSAYLLASYDLDDWRFSLREDLFQTRHLGNTPSPLSEDGAATTVAVSWSGIANLRLTGEVIAMQSRRSEYVLAGNATPQAAQAQGQFSARYSF